MERGSGDPHALQWLLSWLDPHPSPGHNGAPLGRVGVSESGGLPLAAKPSWALRKQHDLGGSAQR